MKRTWFERTGGFARVVLEVHTVSSLMAIGGDVKFVGSVGSLSRSEAIACGGVELPVNLLPRIRNVAPSQPESGNLSLNQD